MFKEIRIVSYRGLRDVMLADLGRVNVLVGENNSGKTSVLEAVQLFENSAVLDNILTVARKREVPFNTIGRSRLLPFDSFLYSFPMETSFKEIYIEAYSDKYGECRVGVRGEEYRDAFYSEDLTEAEEKRYHLCCDEEGMIRFIKGEYMFKREQCVQEEFYFRETQLRPQRNSDKERKISGARRINQIMYISPMDIYMDKILSASLYRGMLVEEKYRLLDLMRLFDERIIGIETAVRQGRPVTMLELEGIGLSPISVFGDGLKKVLTLASAIVKMRNGVILIDEFETGIHKRALGQVAEWLFAVSERYNVQVFLTTHSSDALAALASVSWDSADRLRAYRLEHYRNSVYVKKFDGMDLYRFRNGQGMDIL